MAKYREELDKISNERKSPCGGTVLSEEDYAKFVKNLKERTEAMMKSESGAKFARLGLLSERNLWLNPNSTSLVRAQPDMRRDMVRAHRQVELELFGGVTDLPGEQELLQESSVESATATKPSFSPLSDSMEPMKSAKQHLKAIATGERFPKDSFAVFVRRSCQNLLMICMAYFFIWVPWRGSRVDLLLFIGFGMIQVAGFYMQDLADNPMAPITGPLLFLNPFMSFVVLGLGLVGLVVELIVGFVSKPWWEALLLPIPPYIFTLLFAFPRRNPAPPFFAGVFALFLGVVLKTL